MWRKSAKRASLDEVASPKDGVRREPPYYYPGSHDFNPSPRSHARPRSRQLILFSLDDSAHTSRPPLFGSSAFGPHAWIYIALGPMSSVLPGPMVYRRHLSGLCHALVSLADCHRARGKAAFVA